MNLKQFFLEQYARYPLLQTQDLVKALYQSTFGCGHLIADPQRGLSWITQEAADCIPGENGVPAVVEPLGDAFCRIHLQALPACGLTPGTLFRLFALSAEKPAGDMATFRAHLDELERLVLTGEIPLDAQEAQAFLDEYRRAGCPATHHSETFRRAYQPAYRVIRADWAQFIEVFARIDRLLCENRPVTVAIEGGSASGKSTLGEMIARVYDCNLFHMDDFFLQMHQRTPERFAQPGGNVDYERFRSEVLEPLSARQPFSYRPFSCSTMSLAEPLKAIPGQLAIVEGAYSMHPTLSSFYDMSVFLQIDEELQAERILRRNGAKMQQRFLNEWIPLEKRYFEAFDIPAQCDICLQIS